MPFSTSDLTSSKMVLLLFGESSDRYPHRQTFDYSDYHGTDTNSIYSVSGKTSRRYNVFMTKVPDVRSVHGFGSTPVLPVCLGN